MHVLYVYSFHSFLIAKIASLNSELERASSQIQESMTMYQAKVKELQLMTESLDEKETSLSGNHMKCISYHGMYNL